MSDLVKSADQDFGQRFGKKERIACIFLGSCPEDLPRVRQLAEACLRFSPQIALREHEAIFIEIGKYPARSSSDFEAGLMARFQVLGRRFGFESWVGFADSAGAALALARYGYARRVIARDLPIEALADYASPFEWNPDLQKKVDWMSQSFRKLGVSTLGDFSRLPRSSLSARFGKEGLQLGRAIQSVSVQAWPRFVPDKKIAEFLTVSDEIGGEGFQGVQTVEGILILLQKILKKIVSRLRGRGVRASRIEFILETEHFSTVTDPRRSWEIVFPVPQGAVSGMLLILKERIEQELLKKQLESSVLSLGILVEEMSSGYSAQRNFFHQKEENQEVWDSLIARLCQKLGKRGVFMAMEEDFYLPEKAWSPGLNLYSTEEKDDLSHDEEDRREGDDHDDRNASSDEIPPRPTRLFQKPIPIRKEGSVLYMNQSLFRRWKATEWDGPERISTEWWSQQSEPQRDYYQVTTETGERLWVFSVPNQDGLYLHGVFD